MHREFFGTVHSRNTINTFGQGGICACFVRARRYRVALQLRQPPSIGARGRRKMGSELSAGSQWTWAIPSAVTSAGYVAMISRVWAEAEVVATQQRRGMCGRQQTWTRCPGCCALIISPQGKCRGYREGKKPPIDPPIWPAMRFHQLLLEPLGGTDFGPCLGRLFATAHLPPA